MNAKARVVAHTVKALVVGRGPMILCIHKTGGRKEKQVDRSTYVEPARWELPGGRSNKGEKLLVTLKRELLQEAGLPLPYETDVFAEAHKREEESTREGDATHHQRHFYGLLLPGDLPTLGAIEEADEVDDAKWHDPIALPLDMPISHVRVMTELFAKVVDKYHWAAECWIDIERRFSHLNKQKRVA